MWLSDPRNMIVINNPLVLFFCLIVASPYVFFPSLCTRPSSWAQLSVFRRSGQLPKYELMVPHFQQTGARFSDEAMFGYDGMVALELPMRLLSLKMLFDNTKYQESSLGRSFFIDENPIFSIETIEGPPQSNTAGAHPARSWPLEMWMKPLHASGSYVD